MNIDILPISLGAYAQGLLLSLGLIVAIGAQNAFVLRQGLRREHVGSVVIFCAVIDAVLIAAGVLGMARALGEREWLTVLMTLAGAAFLAVYGWKAFARANKSSQLEADSGAGSLSRSGALSQAAAFTLLNPHVYLDTVLLVGTTGAQHASFLQIWFILGASSASCLWFGVLGFGARWLAPLFARPISWRVLDGIIGVIMWTLSFLLLRNAASSFL
jgi:L-lysine exporter family protein LysE/ArgO